VRGKVKCQPAVIWTSFTARNIYFAKFNGVDDFNTPIQLNPAGLDVQSYNWAGPDMWMDGDNIYVVYKADGFETGHLYLVKSIDNGVTFGDTVRIDNLTKGFAQYPDVAVLNDTVWVAYMNYDSTGSDPQYVVTRSTDAGATFQTEVGASTIMAGEVCDCCQPELLVDDNRVVVIYRNNVSNVREVKGVVSYDRGVTFVDSFSVDDHLWTVAACPSTGPDARLYGPDKAIVIYRTVDLGFAKVFINQYDMLTNTSDALVEVTTSISLNVGHNYPQMDIENGLMGIVWEGFDLSTDIFMNYSLSGVPGLDPDNALNLTAISGVQNRPDIAVDGDEFHVVYADNDGNVKYILVTDVTGIDALDNELDAVIYPNPFSQFTTISLSQELKGQYNARLIDAVGNEVLLIESVKGNQIQIHRGNLSHGVYIFSLFEKVSGKEMYTTRLIVE